jgi:succinate dehydrogenase/fumarate reductase flavoprotein subunit
MLIPDLPKRIENGEFTLPLFADLPGMPEPERRAIFGLMIGNEGKTRIPVYESYTNAGFDPDKDMLQVQGTGGLPKGPPQWRSLRGGCLVTDWEFRSNLEGLYAAGHIGGSMGCSMSSVSGRYAGRKAAQYALITNLAPFERVQVEKEKARIYAPVLRKGGIGWKELHAGIARIMQDYCGEFKGEETLKIGLSWLKSIRESEGADVWARNPHELMRSLECLSRITVGEMVMHASLARKASSRPLGFQRLDHPKWDPPDWNKFVTTRLEDGEVKVGELPFCYWLQQPYAQTYEENYKKHNGI